MSLVSRPHWGVLLFGLATLGSGALAQQPAAVSAPSPAVDPIARIPVHTAADDEGVAYGLWAAGRGYKASFHDGMTFVPYLGAMAKATLALHWQTTSVTVGGRELATHSAAAPRHSDWRVEYDLGAVVEAYDVRAEGLEQTFVLTTNPGPGDLLVRGTVQTPLQIPAVGAAHQALPLVDADGRTVFEYGAATAIDARGQRRPMTTSHEHGTITLRLDAAWLAAATFPVVVDPMLGGGVVSSTFDDAVAVDVLREDEDPNGNVWVAIVRAASATDTDLFVRRCDDDGSNPFTVFQDITTSWSSLEPAVAYLSLPDRALIAFTRDFSAAQTRRVRLHVHDRGNLAIDASVLSVPVAANEHHWRPDVAGTSFNLPTTKALLVMQRESGVATFSNTGTSEIVAVGVDLAGVAFLDPVFVVADQPLTEYERPSVCQYEWDPLSPLNPGWVLVYQARTTLALGTNDTTWNIVARQARADGTVSAPIVVDASNTAVRNDMAPRIAGDTGHYLVAWTCSTVSQNPLPTSGANGHSLRAVRLEWPSNQASGSFPWSTQILNSNTDARVELAGLSFDTDTDSHWGVLFRSNVTQSLYFQSVGHRGDTLLTETVYTPPAGTNTAAGGCGYDNDHDRHTIVYAYGATVALDRFAYNPAPAWSTSGLGCSTANLVWYGSQQIGSEQCGARCLGTPLTSVFLAAAMAPVNQPLLGVPGIANGCWLLVPNTGADHLGFFPVQLGPNASWSLPLPEWLPDMTLYFQGFHLDAAGTAVTTTHRLEVPIRK